MAYQREYTVSEPTQHLGQIEYGENKIDGFVGTLRILALIAEIGATIAAPGVGSAIAIGLAGATAQTSIDYLAGEGNAVTTIINYASSVVPFALAANAGTRATVRFGFSEEEELMETASFINRFNKGSTEAQFVGQASKATASGFKPIGNFTRLELDRIFKYDTIKKGWLVGTRRGLKKGILKAFSQERPLKSLLELEKTVNNFFEASQIVGENWTKFTKTIDIASPKSPDEVLKLWKAFMSAPKSGFTAGVTAEFDILNKALEENVKRRFFIFGVDMYDQIITPVVGKAAVRKSFMEAIKTDLGNMFKNVKAIDAASGLGGQGYKFLPEGKAISRDAINTAQATARKEAFQSEKEFGSWTAEEVASELGSGSIKRSKKGVAKWQDFHAEYQTKWKKTRIDASRGGAEAEERAIERAKRVASQDLLEDIRASKPSSDFYLGRQVPRLRKTKPWQFFGSEKGRFVTQAGQMTSGSDLGRELVNAPSKLLLNGEFDFAGKVWFKWQSSNPFMKAKQAMRETKFGKLTARIYGDVAEIEEQAQKHLIPFVYGSSWLLAVRLIKLDPMGEMNFMIVFHRNSKYPPVFINNVPKKRAIEFLVAPSPGAYYHSPRGWALSANGRDIQAPPGMLALAGIALPSLASIRNFLSLTSNLIGTAKGGMATYTEDLTSALQRNWHSRAVRAVGIIGGGRLGGKYALAIERSFINQTTSNGKVKTKFGWNSRALRDATLTTSKTFMTSRQSAAGRQQRASVRYGQNIVRRPLGQFTKVMR